MWDRRSGYSQQELDNFEIIYFDKNMYVPLNLHIRVLYWYNFYRNHPGGIRLPNINGKVCYRKGILTQVGLSINMCNIFQYFKNGKTIYGLLPPNIIEPLKPCNLVHIIMVGPYSKSTIKQHSCGAIIRKYLILACITMIDPATGWSKICQSTLI